MSEWQPISSAPEIDPDTPLLGVDCGGEYLILFWDQLDGVFYDRDFATRHPTHWMPLPEPPKGDT